MGNRQNDTTRGSMDGENGSAVTIFNGTQVVFNICNRVRIFVRILLVLIR